jgi:tetratricopeptide (TPR) repeat protein
MLRKLPVTCLVSLLPFLLACGHQGEEENTGKIPITSSSEEAIALYREGRDLVDNLHRSEGHQRFARAVELDPDFALAHLAMAETSPTTQEFYSSLERAVALAEKASPGERHLILAQQASIEREPETQRRHYEELVATYPEDERAHIQMALFALRRGEDASALEHLEEAIRINPDYHPAQSLVGYAHKQAGNYEAAEAAFAKCIELLPEEANPYDSYAELMMTTGRFEEAIRNYRLALSKDPDFFFSALGLGHSQALLGRLEEARQTYRDLYGRVGTDGQKRQALTWIAATYAQEGQYDEALATIGEMATLAEATGDRVALSDDHLLMGSLLLAAERAEEAGERFEQAIEILETAEVDDSVKVTTGRNLLYHQARVALVAHQSKVALVAGDLEKAAELTEAYRQAVAQKQLTNEQQRLHELAGRLALAEEDYDTAAEELAQGEPGNPRILYYRALAEKGRGADEAARELAEQALGVNEYSMDYALIHARAQRLLE